jgi:hypothetical protein
VNPIVVKVDQGHLLALGLPIVGGDQQWSAHTSYNPVTVSASKDITEAGVAPLTAAQYEAILNAKSLAVQIVGLKRSATYEWADFAPKFLENLREFYEQKVR